MSDCRKHKMSVPELEQKNGGVRIVEKTKWRCLKNPQKVRLVDNRKKEDKENEEGFPPGPPVSLYKK